MTKFYTRICRHQFILSDSCETMKLQCNIARFSRPQAKLLAKTLLHEVISLHGTISKLPRKTNFKFSGKWPELCPCKVLKVPIFSDYNNASGLHSGFWVWRVQVNLILAATIPSLCFSQFLWTKAKIWQKWQIGSQKLYFPAAAEKLIHDFATQQFAVQKILEPKCNLDF